MRWLALKRNIKQLSLSLSLVVFQSEWVFSWKSLLQTEKKPSIHMVMCLKSKKRKIDYIIEALVNTNQWRAQHFNVESEKSEFN